MKTTFNFVCDRLYALAKEDRGAEGLEKLLIVAAIVLPLLGVLLYFKNAITTWVNSQWDSVASKSGDESNTGTFNPPPAN